MSLDPETYVASRIVLAQPPMLTPARLPGMTPMTPNAALKAAAERHKIKAGARLKIHQHLIGGGRTCPNCNCGRKS